VVVRFGQEEAKASTILQRNDGPFACPNDSELWALFGSKQGTQRNTQSPSEAPEDLQRGVSGPGFNRRNRTFGKARLPGERPDIEHILLAFWLKTRPPEALSTMPGPFLLAMSVMIPPLMGVPFFALHNGLTVRF